jgi:hypothetical protein
MDRAELHTWLTTRLTSERARADFARVLEVAWGEFVARPVAEVLPRAGVDVVVDRYLTPERLAELVRPLATVIAQDVVSDLHDDTTRTGYWVPPSGQLRLERLAARPGVADPDFIRALFRERAIEAMLADTLTTTIREFSTMLPKLILSLMPKGPFGVLGGASAIGTKLVEEVERRLEPEIRSFLQVGTKKALERAATFAVAHTEDPSSVELRKNVVRFVLSRTAAEHSKPINEAVLTEVAALVDEIARHVATLPEARARVTKVLDRFYARYGDGTVQAALEAHGWTTPPPLDALAAAAWPAVCAVVVLPSVTDWRNALVDELLAQAGV